MHEFPVPVAKKANNFVNMESPLQCLNYTLLCKRVGPRFLKMGNDILQQLRRELGEYVNWFNKVQLRGALNDSTPIEFRQLTS